jgi:hypothetical protein
MARRTPAQDDLARHVAELAVADARECAVIHFREQAACRGGVPTNEGFSIGLACIVVASAPRVTVTRRR